MLVTGDVKTGDVKDYSQLPQCNVLVTEATYGSPKDNFREELEKLVDEAALLTEFIPLEKHRELPAY